MDKFTLENKCNHLIYNNMTKTFEVQIELAKAIVAESKKRLSEMQGKGCQIDVAKLESIIEQSKKIEERDEKKAEMRAALSRYTAQLNEEFTSFKGEVTELKRLVKGHYQQYQWKQFGIMDKQ